MSLEILNPEFRVRGKFESENCRILRVLSSKRFSLKSGYLPARGLLSLRSNGTKLVYQPDSPTDSGCCLPHFITGTENQFIMCKAIFLRKHKFLT